MKTKFKNYTPFGFTLMELLVVIAIVSFLASIIFAGFSSARDSARYATVVRQLRSMGNAAYADQLQAGEWAADETRGVAPSFVGREGGTMATWPNPPCDGASYDFENWSGDGGANSSNPDIRISIRDVEGGPYWYCVAHERLGDCRSNRNVAAFGGSGEVENFSSIHNVDTIQCE